MRLLIYVAFCCALAATTSAQTAKKTQTVERVVHVAPFGAEGSRYFYVPFDVPRGAARVSVVYDYAREGGTNTIDIGMFDARGFRGWSGGRRAEFFIARGEATPGYLPGELPTGRWRLLLGLYKVASAGVDVKVRIDIETGGTDRRASKASAPRRSNGAGRKADRGNVRWYAGDLHMHTVHSDGDWTVRELATAAGGAGLDFIFVTDHNTSSHHAEVDEANAGPLQTLVMRGEELTTYGGHANVWGLPAGAVVDFRVRPRDAAGISAAVARAHKLGALISVNHPSALCGGCAWSYGETMREFDAFEVWNGEWDATDEAALKLWDGLLRSGARLTAVASSDTHRAQNPVGQPTAHVAAEELSQAALLNGIRRGRVYLTSEARGRSVVFEATAGEIGSTAAAGARTGVGDEIRLAAPGSLVLFVRVGDAPRNSNDAPGRASLPAGAVVSLVSEGRVVRTWTPDSLTEVFEVECERDGYYRLEVRDRAGKMLALTNPIYVRVGARR